MGAHSARQPTVYRQFVELARNTGTLYNGQHNANFVLPLNPEMARLVPLAEGTEVMVRIPRLDVPSVTVKTWPCEEAAILVAIRDFVRGAPTCLMEDWGQSELYTFVPGEPLSAFSHDGSAVDAEWIAAMAGVLARLALVPRDALPRLPANWPQDGDSRAFLKHLAGLTDRDVRQHNMPEYGLLFRALGVPEDGLTTLAARLPDMTSRPYSLLHADLHRGNVVIPFAGDPLVLVVDWELATYGDPLHDLAVHLIRSRYPEWQEKEVIDTWEEMMLRTSPESVRGLHEDLPHYLAFERAQSVYPDVIRAARDLRQSPDRQHLTDAVRQVHRALTVAAGPLAMRDVPDPEEIAAVLLRWTLFAPGEEIGGGRATESVDWRPGRGHPYRDDFSDAQVGDALLAERSVPARAVRRGTAYVNSVVRVPGRLTPVVVRRRIEDRQIEGRCPRREQGVLPEHLVLRQIERATTGVAVPRLLALGEDGDRGTAFAVHTYVGQGDGGAPPEHPVDGLRPNEADDLVDQLCALTSVDYLGLDPMATAWGFYERMTDRLVRMVESLPERSRHLAEEYGLPGPGRLRRILSRYQVTPRTPTLLHGDLHPWNLVRLNEERFALALVDWELAMVGDPLYDLIRHHHLTRSRPVVRHRMLTRWERSLPVHYTRDWRRDRLTYERLEAVRSAYVDLDRLVTRTDLEAPNVDRAVASIRQTLDAALTGLNLGTGPMANPYLRRALPG
ncbi:phosphotransferase [Streptomyces turgidiscabies]|uniref:aminoglycoside phosphotransferase family protein n=1 Tax=Streptomyces TaxID=1883 RepID=UPI00076E9D4B|nr:MULTISPECIES: aminoglycoside phosphotransferase family protein [Streptomyces]MDX3492889.1 aminoglycoside phosphotransferase family protein [Streptomyces turgidiscabies]GAQ74261.1 phosphotransferase enzyme family protein [Streptomyces turgidiscabies]